MPDTLVAAVELAGLAVDAFSMPEVLLVAEFAVEGQLLIVSNRGVDHLVPAWTHEEGRLLLYLFLRLTHQ